MRVTDTQLSQLQILARSKVLYPHEVEAINAAVTALSHAAGQEATTNPAEIGRKSVGEEAVAYIVPVARVTQDGSYEDGPSELCFADEADDYVRRVGAPLYLTPAQPPASAEVGRDAERRKWFDAGWEKCKLLTPGEVCRFFASGPEGSFFTKTLVEAQNLLDVACFDSDEWTVTDLLDPVAAASGRKESPIAVVAHGIDEGSGDLGPQGTHTQRQG